jgi:hypothetical protein
MSEQKFYLSIVDHRDKANPQHLYRGENMSFSELTTKLDDFFIDWDEAFEQDNKGVAIGQIYHGGGLDYEHFGLVSIGTEEVLYSDLNSDLECFEKKIVADLDMFVIKHQVKLAKNRAAIDFDIYIGRNKEPHHF